MCAANTSSYMGGRKLHIIGELESCEDEIRTIKAMSEVLKMRTTCIIVVLGCINYHDITRFFFYLGGGKKGIGMKGKRVLFV